MSAERKVVWFPITCQEGINPNSSSARIRGRWVFDKIQNCVNGFRNVFKPEEVDVFVFQKWCNENACYRAERFKELGKKVILDMCDPVWLDESQEDNFIRMVNACDAVVFSTDTLKDAFEKKYPLFKSKKLFVVIDRHDMNEIGTPLIKKEKENCEETVLLWHGHQNNTNLINKIIPKIKEASYLIRGLKLQIIPEKVIEDGFKGYDNVVQDAWNEETIYDLIRNADVVLNPTSKFGEYAYKSDNKTSLAWCLGTKCLSKDVMDEDWVEEIVECASFEPMDENTCFKNRERYDVWKSVEEWKKIIREV